MPAKTGRTPAAIDRIIRRHIAKFRKPGVLTVRPGFEIAKHQLTGKSAIVVTVHTKLARMPSDEQLPDSLERMPVDVREASAHQRLRAHDPAAAKLTQAFERPGDKEPDWPFEREMPSGQLLDSPRSMTQKRLKLHAQHHPAMTQALAAHQKKQKKAQIKYTPPKDAPLTAVQTTTTITAHVSPDAGLATLEPFLEGTQKSLVIGMYDFTSGPILSTFLKTLRGGKTLQMVLDNPSLNGTASQSNAQTIQELDKALGKRSKIVRALDNMDALVSAWIFPFAYHIKVIVRDGSAFWLSSGNLNNSNQPDLATPPTREDRDWHVIVEDAKLAKLFAAYLNNDFAVATLHQGPPAVVASAIAEAQAKLAAETKPPPPVPLQAAPGRVAARKFTGAFKITPLLTPDTLPASTTGQYLSNIISLIKSAQQKLYIQLQYIESSKGSGPYDTLLQAIADRVKAGVDVRLIEDQQFGEKWAEKMKSIGVDLTANIALQQAVHNKGFVVDSRIVVVSSQNFSPAGVQTNRDAGLIIENQKIAQYFEQVFLSDWKTRAKPFAH
jgi:phosphatidylserine/phosphatidylglycerophosphate/cardiolipin synthase-like enzyme